jgi:hypothetical protein
MLRLMWLETAVTLIVAAVALILVVLAKRPVAADELGSVSDHWIAAEHRVE